jgi:hypothetical protein
MLMRIIAVLSWYDEPVDWLRECVASARFCDHLIAVDGPYAAFPGAVEMPSSPPDQAEAIREAWPGCTVHVRPEPWTGEVSKRDYTIQLAVAAGADWVFVIDADEVVTVVPGNLREQLASTSHHVATCEFEYLQVPSWLPGGWSIYPIRRMYRALPGLRIEGSHCRVLGEADGRTARLSDPDLLICDPAEPLGLRIRHREHERSPERRSLKADYYKLLPVLEK